MWQSEWPEIGLQAGYLTSRFFKKFVLPSNVFWGGNCCTLVNNVHLESLKIYPQFFTMIS